MKRNENVSNGESPSGTAPSRKKNFIAVIVLIALFAAAMALGYRWTNTPPPVEPAREVLSPSPVNTSPAADTAERQPRAREGSLPALPQAAPTAAASALNEAQKSEPDTPGSSVRAQELVTHLSQLDPSHGPLTKEQVKELNQDFKRLIAQGAAAVPVIQGFLERNQDINFTEMADGNPLDSASMRLGLIQALEKIGGPEALTLTAKTLETAGDPLEIAMLTRSLEKQSPGEYREMELKAALEALNMASNNQLNGRSANPLFEVFQHFGDATVVPELEKAVSKSEWRYQAATALSEMPDGAGVPALIRLAKDPQVAGLDHGDVALRALAQVATRYPDAQAALLDQARAGKIPETAWPAVASALSGTYVFAYAHQVLGTADSFPGLTNPQIPERLALMDQMISAASADPGAIAALKEHRAALASRLSVK